MHMRPPNSIISFSLTADFSPVVYIGHNSLTPSSVGTHLGQCHFLVIKNNVARNNAGECLCGGAQRGEEVSEGPVSQFSLIMGS